MYEELLTAIEDGSVALMHAPPLGRDGRQEHDPVTWIEGTLRFAPMNARQILEECINIAAKQFATTSEADLPMAIEKAIADDMLRMQLQPAIMDDYRRFVVLTSRNDRYLTECKLGVRRMSLIGSSRAFTYDVSARVRYSERI